MSDRPALSPPTGWGVTFVGALLVAGLVASGVAAPAVAAPAGAGVADDVGTNATDDGAVANATMDYGGEAVVERPGETFLWLDGPVTVTASVDGNAPSRLCLVLIPPIGEPRRVECAVTDAGTATFRFTVADELGGRTGTYRVELRSDGGDATTYDAGAVTVVSRRGDYDHDRLSNAREANGSTDLADPDTDDDGLRDGNEVMEYDTSPTSADTDGDGRRDGVEVLVGTKPTVADAGSGIEASGLSSKRAAPPDRGVLDWLVAHPGAAGLGILGLVGLVLAGFGFRTIRRSRTRRSRPGADGGDRRSKLDGNAPVTGLDAETTDDRPTGALTDEEYVVLKLRAHDGRMKQSELVEATGWSKAKTSRVLSRAEAAGLIRKNTVGRENVILLDAGP